MDEVDYEWGAEESLKLLDENQKQWAMAGKKWRLAREMLKPFSGENVLIIGETAPPASTLSRMVMCGGGEVSILEDLTFLNDYNMYSKDMNTNLFENTELKIFHHQGANIFSGRTLIIAASKSSNDDDWHAKICMQLKERGVTTLLKSPVYLLDALCRASVTPACAPGAAMMKTNIIPNVVEPLQHKTLSFTPEEVSKNALSVASSSRHNTSHSKRRKVSLTSIQHLDIQMHFYDGKYCTCSNK